MKYSLSLQKLIEHFASLPGVGQKSAAKMAFSVLDMPREQVADFATDLIAAREQIKKCKVCQNLTESEVCSLCSDDERDGSVICVVESPRDVQAIDRTRVFSGRYHVLHGLLSPLNRVGPDDIAIRELISRMGGEVREVILATSPTVDGEATAMYIGRLIKPFEVRVSRLASGLPVGGELEYADNITLQKAMEFRTEL